MTILWDWNGTLIADVEHVVNMNNLIFSRHGYPPTTVDVYRRLFRHPVHDYYYDLGVTKEDFPVIAKEWNAAYVAGFGCVSLAPGVVDALQRFRAAGHRQVIISASQVDQLRAQVVRFPELDGMFDEVIGLDNVYAVSKVHLAQEYLARTGGDPAQTVFLGDTTHDAETAAGIGCRCYLIEGGHQGRPVLETAVNAKVVSTLAEVLAELGC